MAGDDPDTYYTFDQSKGPIYQLNFVLRTLKYAFIEVSRIWFDMFGLMIYNELPVMEPLKWNFMGGLYACQSLSKGAREI